MSSFNPYQPPSGDLRGGNAGFVPEPFTGVGQVLAKGFGLFFRNFMIIFGLTLVTFAPVDLVKNLLIYDAGVDDTNVMRINMILGAVIGALLTPAVLFAIVEPMRTGEPTTLGQSLKYGFKRWAETFGVNFVSGFFIGLGMLLFVVPGIIVALWYAFVSHVVALEDRSIGTLARSKEISAGYRWKMFGVYFLVSVLYVVVAFTGGMALGVVDNWIVSWAVDLLVNAFFPLFSVVGLVMYIYIVHGNERDPSWAARARWAPRDVESERAERTENVGDVD